MAFKKEKKKKQLVFHSKTWECAANSLTAIRSIVSGLLFKFAEVYFSSFVSKLQLVYQIAKQVLEWVVF